MSIQHTGLQGNAEGLGALLLLLFQAVGTTVFAGTSLPDLEVFVRAGCSHCEAANIFLDELQRTPVTTDRHLRHR